METDQRTKDNKLQQKRMEERMEPIYNTFIKNLKINNIEETMIEQNEHLTG